MSTAPAGNDGLKTILLILCVLMVLFGGGCAVMLLSWPGLLMFVVIPIAIIAVNVTMIMALLGRLKGRYRPLFILVGLVDLVIVGFFATSGGNGLYGTLVALLFLLKGVLSFVYAAKVRPDNA